MRAFVEAGGGGLTEFADWVDGQVAGNLLVTESILTDLDEDVVRIMTVHGAKGLEFPVVILAGLRRRPTPTGRALGPSCVRDGRR